jgi:hypothetical protein
MPNISKRLSTLHSSIGAALAPMTDEIGQQKKPNEKPKIVRAIVRRISEITRGLEHDFRKF